MFCCSSVAVASTFVFICFFVIVHLTLFSTILISSFHSLRASLYRLGLVFLTVLILFLLQLIKWFLEFIFVHVFTTLMASLFSSRSSSSAASSFISDDLPAVSFVPNRVSFKSYSNDSCLSMTILSCKLLFIATFSIFLFFCVIFFAVIFDLGSVSLCLLLAFISLLYVSMSLFTACADPMYNALCTDKVLSTS